MSHAGLQISQFFWLILIAFGVALLTRRLRIPYSLALVVTGLAIGVPRLLPQVHLDPEILLTVYLPPLLFESAIHLRWTDLRRDWKPLSVYVLGGTVASTFIIGGLTSLLLRIPLPPALVFGALISTTDPISVIAVFKRLGAVKRLSRIVEAESLFNNDTAVVLFTVLMATVTGGSVSWFASLVLFFQLVVGGVLLGAILGVAASRVHYELDDHLIEITLTTVAAFGSYLAAEALHVSGVMAVITAGLVVGNIGMPTAMSAGTRLAVAAFWEYAAFVVNSIVFLLIGVEVSFVHWNDKLGLAAGAILIVLAGRAAVYPLSLLVNRLGGEIPLAWQHVLFWGGLRGALSMALALGLSPTFPHRDALIAATFAVVLFSLLAQGLTLGPLLKRLGLSNVTPGGSGEQHSLSARLRACRAALDELERLRASEAYPLWAVDRLIRDYQFQQEALQIEEGNREREGPATESRSMRELLQAALSAEKNALKAAEQDGQLETGEWKRLVSRIDARLAALHAERQD